MVTIQEALSQVSLAEESATEREKEIRDIESQFGSLRQPGTLKEQFSLGGRVGSGGVGRELFLRRTAIRKEKKRGGRITAEARKGLGSFRSDIAGRKAQISAIQKQQAEEVFVKKSIAEGGRFSPVGVPSRLRKQIQAGIQAQARGTQSLKQKKVLKEQGLDAIFIDGKLTGFESEKLGLSFELGSLPQTQPESIQSLVKVGLITVGTIEPESSQTIPPANIRAGFVGQSTPQGTVEIPIATRRITSGLSTVTTDLSEFDRLRPSQEIKKLDVLFLKPGEGERGPGVVILPGTKDVEDLAEIVDVIGDGGLDPFITGGDQIGGGVTSPTLGSCGFGGFNLVGFDPKLGIDEGRTVQERVIRKEASGEFGGISISAADDSLRTFVERREPIGGAFEFFVEKGRGVFGKLEETFTPGSQKLAGGITGERVSTGAQILPFVIPVTAPIAFVSTGISQFATPGGRAEAEDIGLGLEQRFGIPAKVGEVGTFGLSALGVVAGGAGLIRQAETALGFPKFSVQFASQQQPIQQVARVGDEILISTKGVAQVTRRGLISERTAFTGFESVGKVSVGEDTFTFLTATRGASREFRGLQLPTGKRIFGKPQPFGGLTEGIGQQGQVSVSLDLPSIGGVATRDVEGFKFISSTNLFTQRGRDFDKFITFGTGKDFRSGLFTESTSGSLQKTFKLSGAELTSLGRTGRAEIAGVTRRAPIEDIGAGTLILGSRRVNVAKALSQQTSKDVIAQSFPKSVADLFTRPAVSTLGSFKSIELQFPSTVQVGGRAIGSFTGTGQFERSQLGGLLPPTTNIKVSSLGFSLPRSKDIQASNLGLGLSTLFKQSQRESQLSRSLSILAQPSAQQPRTRSIQRTSQRTLQLQGQRQTFKTPSPTDFFAPPVAFTGGFGGIGFPLPKRSKRGKKKKTKVTRKIRSSSLAPSFTASALGLTGKFPTPRRAGLGLTPEQFRLIPVRRRKRKRK